MSDMTSSTGFPKLACFTMKFPAIQQTKCFYTLFNYLSQYLNFGVLDGPPIDR